MNLNESVEEIMVDSPVIGKFWMKCQCHYIILPRRYNPLAHIIIIITGRCLCNSYMIYLYTSIVATIYPADETIQNGYRTATCD